MLSASLTPIDLKAMTESPWPETDMDIAFVVFRPGNMERHNDWISTVTHMFVLYTRWLEESLPGDKKHALDVEIMNLLRYLMGTLSRAEAKKQFYTHPKSAINPWYRNLTQ